MTSTPDLTPSRPARLSTVIAAARRNARIGASIGYGGTATGTITGLHSDKLHIRTDWGSDITVDVKDVACQLAGGTYYLDTYPDGTPL